MIRPAKFCRLAAALFFAASPGTVILQGQQQKAELINVQPEEAPALANALKARGLDLAVQDPGSAPFSGVVVVLEARGELRAATLQGLEIFVRRGGSLLIGLDKNPGIAPSQLAFLSPTTAWITQANTGSRPLFFAEIASGAADPEIFGTARRQSFTLPYFFRSVQSVPSSEASPATTATSKEFQTIHSRTKPAVSIGRGRCSIVIGKSASQATTGHRRLFF